MALAQGTRLGAYEILSPLGAGGMGEVYRATDTRLKRQVAIKILPEDLATDPTRLARFQREAEVLASLNHPHIAAIYGFEESNGVKALVMELVDGPTLADRIERGAIPFDEALPIARQIAEALEAAHEQGIVHRDLKPANIKVREDGTVKVLDFGLAKPREKDADSSSGIDATLNLAQSPTMAPRALAVSHDGVILGTAAYMSPEQARGRAVDKRSDVWAFGAVLFEMLSGARAFEGDDLAEVIAAVVKSTPNWSALPADVPSPVVTLIQRCLEKDRKTRIGDIAVARFLLSGDAAAATPGAPISSVAIVPARRWPAMLAATLAAAMAGVAIGWWLPHRASTAEPALRLQMDLAPAERLVSSANSGSRPVRGAFALSPDGRHVAFAGTRGAVTQIYLRDFDRSEASAVPGTDNAHSVFFSPDGTWIGFVADGKIKKIPAGGGPPTTIADLPPGSFWGASWGEDGNVYYAVRAGIFRIPAAGGTATAVTKVDPTKNDRNMLPQLLPGGVSLLFTAPPSIVVMTLATGEQHSILDGASDARYVGTGHLLYMKSGTLMAVPFDVRGGKPTGTPAAVIENVMQAMNAYNGGDETGVGQFAASQSGTLLYATGGAFPPRQTQLTWVDRSGGARPVAGAQPRTFLNPRLSPDGQRIAVAARNDDGQGMDIYAYDAARGTPLRLTFDGGARPVWSPDGKRIAYNHSENGVANLYVINADGSGKPERLTTNPFGQTASSWAAGTNTISIIQRSTADMFGIYLLAMDQPHATPTLLLESRFAMTHAELSPDGRWIVYQSTESGSPEIYVQAVSGSNQKTRLTNDGGFDPVWTSHAREIVFRTTPTLQKFVAVAIEPGSPFKAGEPRTLFEAGAPGFDATTPVRAWDATADGQRFVALRVGESTSLPVTTLHVALNWFEELKRLASK